MTPSHRGLLPQAAPVRATSLKAALSCLDQEDNGEYGESTKWIFTVDIIIVIADILYTCLDSICVYSFVGCENPGLLVSCSSFHKVKVKLTLCLID